MLATRTASWLVASLVLAMGLQVAAAPMATNVGVTETAQEQRFLAQKQPPAVDPGQQGPPPGRRPPWAGPAPAVTTTTAESITTTSTLTTTTTTTTTMTTSTAETSSTSTRTRRPKRTRATTTRTTTVRTTRYPNVEITTAEAETTTTEVETATPEVETTTTEVESETDEPETTTTEVETGTAAPETTAEAATTTATPMAAPAEACLCVFDVDRTLTSKQGTAGRCPGAKQVDGIWDFAFGGGNFTLSELGSLGIGATFCDGCLLGVVTAGTAQAEGDYLLSRVLRSSAYDKALASSSISGFGWSSSPTSVSSPFITHRGGHKKLRAVTAIVGLYQSSFPGLSIPNNRVHFFDDRAENVAFFVGTGYNARQVSCAPRDFSIYNRTGRVGLCGARVTEIVADEGVVKCQSAAPR